MKEKLIHQSISQIQSLNDRAGYHFFEKGTMRFFNSRFSADVYAGADGWYFVTSEKNKGFMTGTNYPRKFTVRRCDPQGDIDTIGKFQEFRTLEMAKLVAKQYAFLSTFETETCPTTNGHDLELWEVLKGTK